jgi:hypothetical protein
MNRTRGADMPAPTIEKWFPKRRNQMMTGCIDICVI